MYSKEKLSQVRQKTEKASVKNLFTQTHLTVLNITKTAEVNGILKYL